MRFLIFNISWIGVLFLIWGMGYAGPAMTLEECLEAGQKNNPSLLASKYYLEGAGHDISAARADFLPSLSSGYSVSRLKNESTKGVSDTDYLDQAITNFNIKLTQILYAGSRIINSYEKAKLMEQVARFQMEMKSLELAYNIETTFYKMKRADQDIIIINKSVERLTESVKAVEAFFKGELVPYVDVLQARVELSNAQAQLGIAENNFNRERIALLSLMDIPQDKDVEFTGSLDDSLKDDPSFELSRQHAIQNRPDIMALEQQLKVTEKDRAIAVGKYMPVVRADIGYYNYKKDYDEMGTSAFGRYDRDQKNGYWQAGVYVSWEMFDGGRAFYEKEKHIATAKKIDALIIDTRNAITTGIQKALYSLSEAKQRIDSSIEALVAAEEYFSQEQGRLHAGISTIPALLDAQSRLVRAQGNKIQAMLDYQMAKSEFKLMTGGQKL